MLIMAAAAAQIIRASRLDAGWRGGQDALKSGAKETFLLFNDSGFYGVARKDEGNEDSPGASIGLLDSSETVSAIDEFFNHEFFSGSRDRRHEALRHM
jgi:hypothetical protein